MLPQTTRELFGHFDISDRPKPETLKYDFLLNLSTDEMRENAFMDEPFVRASPTAYFLPLCETKDKIGQAKALIKVCLVVILQQNCS